MSNLEAARAALQAELEHSKTGHAYYATQIVGLEQALAQIASLGGGGIVGGENTIDLAPKTKRGGKPIASKIAETRSAKLGRPRKLALAPKALPRTGGDFWAGLVTQAPQFGPDILAAAVAKLGFEPTAEQRKALGNRMAPALAALVKSGKVVDSGKGRLHRYFKP